MKLLYFLSICLVLRYVSASWLADVFTGLNEAVEDKIGDKKDVWDGIKEKVKDKVKNFQGLKNIPILNDGVIFLKKHWDSVEKKTNDEKEKYLKQWNALIEKMYYADTDSAERILHKFKRVSHKLKKLLPAELYKEMKKNADTVVETFKKKVREATKKVDDMTEKLKEKVKNWEEPSFMKSDHVLKVKKDMKMYITDAVKFVNKHVEKASEKIEKLNNENKEEDSVEEDEEKKLDKLIAKYFVKPHEGLKSIGCDTDCLARISAYWKGFQELKHDKVEKKKAVKDALEFMKKHIPTKAMEQLKKASKVVMPLVVDIIPPSDDGSEKTDTINTKEKDDLKEAEKKWEENFEKNKMTKLLKPVTEHLDDENDDEMVTGNENWDIYKHYIKEVMSGKPKVKKAIQLKNIQKKVKAFKKSKKMADWDWIIRKVAGEKFGDDVEKEAGKWFALKRGVLNKLKKMEKFLKK